MAYALEDLVKFSKKESFKDMCAHFSDYTDEQFDFLLQKGVFPYDWFDQYCKLEETSLPPKREFSTLKGEDISDENYDQAQKV